MLGRAHSLGQYTLHYSMNGRYAMQIPERKLLAAKMRCSHSFSFSFSFSFSRCRRSHQDCKTKEGKSSCHIPPWTEWEKEIIRRPSTSWDPFAHRAIDRILRTSSFRSSPSHGRSLARQHYDHHHHHNHHQAPIMRCTVESGGSSCSHLPALASAERRENSTCWSVIRDNSC